MSAQVQEITSEISKSDRSKALLVEAASAILRERNTINLTLSELAERSGMNSALVKYHFGNKEGLLFAVLENQADRWVEELDKLLARDDLSPTEKMQLHLSGLMDTYVTAPFVQRLHNAIMRDTNDDNRKKISDRMIRPIYEAQKKILEAGFETGEFLKVDPTVFYFSASGAVSFVFTQNYIVEHTFGIVEIDDDMRRQYKRQTIEMVMKGILAN